MIRVAVLYPNGNGIKFDMAYYTSKHMPMVKRLCGPACKSIAADRGLNAGQSGSSPPYVAIGYLTFDSVEAFESAFGPHVDEIMGDIPNYTNAKPVVLISEVSL